MSDLASKLVIGATIHHHQKKENLDLDLNLQCQVSSVFSVCP